jgi:hypothetical protein
VSEPIEAMPPGPTTYPNGFWRALEDKGDRARDVEEAKVQALLTLASAVSQLAAAVDRAATPQAAESATPHARRRRWRAPRT